MRLMLSDQLGTSIKLPEQHLLYCVLDTLSHALLNYSYIVNLSYLTHSNFLGPAGSHSDQLPL